MSGRCICIKDLSACDDVYFKAGDVFSYEFHPDPMSTVNRQFIYSVGNTYFTNRNTDNFYDYFMDVLLFRDNKLNAILSQ